MKIQTSVSLAGLMFATARAEIIVDGVEVKPEIDILTGGAGSLEYKRINLALAALERNANYILWIDTDQTFPWDALVRLLNHDKPIVGGNYPSRHEGSPTSFSFNNKPVMRRSGLERVAAVGLGFCLMQAGIFHRIPRPWFASEIDEDGKCLCGEDVHFCNQARAAGIPVYVDHDLSIGHIAETVLMLEKESDSADTVLSASGP